MFVSIFTKVLAPILVVAGLAFLLGRYAKVNSRPLAQASFFLFNPSLAFVSLATTAVAPEMLGRLVLLKWGVLVILIAGAWLLAWQFKLPPVTSSAFILAVAFANAGNFGLSVNEFAFGQAGLALAVVSYLADNLALNSVGVYIAARGHAGMRAALLQVFRNPAVYAVILGLATHEFGWKIPVPIWNGLELLSRAAVPTMLTVLGVQLATLPLARGHLRLVGLAAVLRLGVAPALAALLALPLGLTGLARQVGIVQAAVPTAVMASIVASRFDTDPNLVATSVLVSSLASLVTVTLLLTWI